MEQPILQVKNLIKHFAIRQGVLKRSTQVVRAVDGVSFDLDRGKTIGIVGESGCGKSTLARTLMFLEEPTSGEIVFDSRQVSSSDANSLRKRMQVVFQDPYTSLPPRMTVRNVIADPMRIHRLCEGNELESRVDSVMREVGLDPRRAGQYPFQFSGGQRQRIGIARALVMEPEVLILDESVSALDVSIQAQVLNLLQSVQTNRQLSYLFISHDLRVVQHMSDSIAVMYLGKIVEHGLAEAIYANPIHPYTVALLEAIPGMGSVRKNHRVLQGEPPNPANPPAGCSFHPRCPMARDQCRTETPLLQEWLPGRFSACHFADELVANQPSPARSGPPSAKANGQAGLS